MVVGFGMWAVLPLIDVKLSLFYCLLFGALISPADPIAAMGILRSAGAPKNLELVIAGVSLFSDGVGVVIFALLLGILASGTALTVPGAAGLLLREAGGGIAFGLALGYVTFRLLRSIDHYQVEVLLTLAAVMGGYALARHLEVSGPLAMVVCGLMIGNDGRELAMSTLATRWLTVGLPVAAASAQFGLPPGSSRVLNWGGLRAGISVALALSLPVGAEREIILALTYCVVAFSILVQGMTIGRAVRAAIGGAN